MQSFESSIHPKKIIIISKDLITAFISKQELGMNIDNYVYLHLSIIIPKHELCSPHRILSQDEEDNLLYKELYKEKSNLPIICVNDPMIVWIGGEPGQIVEIERVSELAGKSLVYRRITKDLLI
jgi:DNA-directed RNA polymerase subunit H (RpoH/RPB5)